MTFFAGLAGCGSGETPIDVSRNLMQGGAAGSAECEALGVQLNHQIMVDLGLDVMSWKMDQISAVLSPRDKNSLQVLGRDLDRPSLSPELHDRHVGTIHKIYGRAIVRAGQVRRSRERIPAIRRSILTEPTRTGLITREELQAHGNTVMMTSTPMGTVVAKPGKIAEAYLIVAPDQKQEFLLTVYSQVGAGPNRGYAAGVDELTLTEYVQTQLPANCRAH